MIQEGTSPTPAWFADRLGHRITVGAQVVAIDRTGAVLWSRRGTVVGLGRSLVHVHWAREIYIAKRRYDAVPGERLRVWDPSW